MRPPRRVCEDFGIRHVFQSSVFNTREAQAGTTAILYMQTDPVQGNITQSDQLKYVMLHVQVQLHCSLF